MLRWLAFCVLSGVAIFASVYGLTKYLHKDEVADADRPSQAEETQDPTTPSQPKVSTIGPRQTPGQQMVVVKDARFVSTTKRDIPSERDGKLLVVGTEITPEEEAKLPGSKILKNIPVATLAVEAGPNEKLAPEDTLVLAKRPGKRYKRYRPGMGMDADSLVPGSVEIAVDFKTFRELQVGDHVKAGKLVALVNPVLAIDELAVKQQKN